MTVDSVGSPLQFSVEEESMPFGKAWVRGVCVSVCEICLRFCLEGALSSSVCSKLVRFSKSSRTSVSSI